MRRTALSKNHCAFREVAKAAVVKDVVAVYSVRATKGQVPGGFHEQIDALVQRTSASSPAPSLAIYRVLGISTCPVLVDLAAEPVAIEPDQLSSCSISLPPSNSVA
ncbi:hypothetical protein [Nocardia sp. NPDC059239]|uniref:hypothetical protein n=1 Tax=unclassified Nocardia TaxID=2637762 RepID=UPI00368372E1